MKRRRFLGSLAATAALPALPSAALAPRPEVQFWARYFAALPGHSPVRGLQIALNLTAAQAQRAVAGLVAQGTVPTTALAPLPPRNVPGLKFEKLIEKQKVRLPAALRDLRALVSCDCDDQTVCDQSN